MWTASSPDPMGRASPLSSSTSLLSGMEVRPGWNSNSAHSWFRMISSWANNLIHFLQWSFPRQKEVSWLPTNPLEGQPVAAWDSKSQLSYVTEPVLVEEDK
jgi:hypothetical protein